MGTELGRQQIEGAAGDLVDVDDRRLRLTGLTCEEAHVLDDAGHAIRLADDIRERPGVLALFRFQTPGLTVESDLGEAAHAIDVRNDKMRQDRIVIRQQRQTIWPYQTAQEKIAQHRADSQAAEQWNGDPGDN